VSGTVGIPVIHGREDVNLATAKGQPTSKPAVTAAGTGPFQVRQRSNAPGPLDLRQRGGWVGVPNLPASEPPSCETW
jgi:hypothetical protein